MKAMFEKGDLGIVEAELLVIPCMKGRVPEKAVSLLKERAAEKDFDGSRGKTLLIHTPKERHARIFLIGMGKEKNVKIEDFRAAGGKAYACAASLSIEKCAVWIDERMELQKGSAAQAFVEGFFLRSLKVGIYKGKKKDEEEGAAEPCEDDEEDADGVKEILVVCKEDVSRNVREGQVLAEAQNYARLLDQEPANIMTPQRMADEALLLAKKYGMDCTVFTSGELEKEGMRGLLAVGKGSTQSPIFVKISYNEGKGFSKIALVGKALTFDSGGICIKPSKGMSAMKYDKSGALVLLGVMRALAELRVPVCATLYFGAVENMPDGNATKPGDVVKAYNGKTIEIVDTDAEGRVCLADVVSYAASRKPDLIVDVATLTGAMSIILGRYGAGVMGTDEKAIELMQKCGEHTHEKVWPLPLWDEYSEMIKSEIADVKNLGSDRGEAGTITAAMFIKEFTEGVPWMHLDIASVDHVESPTAYLRKGPSGKHVRSITEFIRRWAQESR
ncbi:MAG: leucyl aminopeptidase [Candidatus Bilamarchaeaceae archaeon]